MLNTIRAGRGMVVAPHHLAAQAGLGILREGGNAIEAMVAAVATVSVVYPHMNGLGGDGFWLIRGREGGEPLAIQGIGAAAGRATPEWYAAKGVERIPERGPLAANTVAGTVPGWAAALEESGRRGGRLALARLLEDAIHYAEHGFPATPAQIADTLDKQAELADVPGWAGLFMPGGRAPAPGESFRNPALAGTLRRIAADGADGFRRGDLARAIAADLARVGSPLSADDLAAHRPRLVAPLALRSGLGGGAVLWNHPPPTQGLAALMIVGLFERLDCGEADGFDHVHGLVEATRLAFRVRDGQITDPAYMTVDPAGYLEAGALDRLAARIDPARAGSGNATPRPGDTVWLGAADDKGLSVSFIHSIYWEFGSGVVLDETGILWQNRGCSFGLAEGAPNRLAPGRLPFHTNNPALAAFDDGRTLCYGSMGGDGQPQTQAAVLTRYARFGQELQAAVTAPRWLLGRRWGEHTTKLRLESRFDPAVARALAAAGHEVETIGPFSSLMGHAGALSRRPSGDGGEVLEGAADPRGDGVVAAW